MDSIQIGKIIALKRKEKGITQEELARHLGVSKPAVSKWESGQSYPDIILLPELAAYFNISVDQLIGYEPQMTKEDVRKLYQRLAGEFAELPFDKVYDECEEYIKKYFSCWDLLNHIALLYVNHANLAGDSERINTILERALDIFTRVEKSCEDGSLAKLALQMKAVCYLTLQKPVEAVDILEKLNENVMSTEYLLIKAYQMKGETNKAIEYLQGFTAVSLLAILEAGNDFIQMYADRPERMQEYYELFSKLSVLFEVEALYPAAVMKIHVIAAMVYTSQRCNDKAMDSLEKYVSIVNKSSKDKFLLNKNRYFDELDSYYASMRVEKTAPRNAKVIWEDLKNALLNNPAFAPLEKEERFRMIKNRLVI
jgi:transcriptional regulator with XRE-family HTH domain